MPMIVLLCSACIIGSTVITGLIHHYALKHRILDVPNARSSHTVPTPRGGGLSIVLCSLLAFPALAWSSHRSSPQPWLIAFFGALVGLVGFLDDRWTISAKWRLLAHLLVAGLSVWVLGGMPPVDIFGRAYDLGWVGHCIATMGLVWMLNLYNFMDGIDGLAASEAVVAAGVMGLVGLQQAPGAIWPEMSLIIAGASLGFLVWNYPKARIFMGDAGSGFLGYMFGVFILSAMHSHPALLWAWLTLLSLFVVDATYTLIRRALRRDNLFAAHRTHAYQHLALRFNSHVPVTAGAIGVNLLLGGAVSWTIARSVHLLGLFLTVCLALVMVAARVGAGTASLSSKR